MPISDPIELARACGEAMYGEDMASQGLGIQLEQVEPGNATMTMPVRANMLNGHGVCHGGFIFALADSAFAFACNSHNHNAVASGARIEYVAPAHLNDKLTAVAEERFSRGRTGVYDVLVKNQHDRKVALFRGNSHRIKGTVIAEKEEG